MRPVFLLMILFTFVGDAYSQNQEGGDSPLKIGANYRIYPSNVTQTETFIAKSLVDPYTFFATCNTITFIPFFISEGIYVTVDAGSTWTGSDSCTGYPIEYHGGDPGNTIDQNGTLILTHKGRDPFVGLYCNYSTDNGMTWSAQNVISTDDLERASLTTDAIITSLYYGRTYAAWIKFASPFPLMFAYTDNVMQKWSTPVPINNPSNRSAGGDLAVGPGGMLYACWAGVTEISPFKEILVGFASSANGGGNWNVTENAFPVNGITGVLPLKNNIRVNGLPSIAVDTTSGPRRGWIYIVTGQKDLAPAGTDPDIIFYRSTDGGQTWSPGIRVNQDALNNGKTQYFPAIHVDIYGGVNIIFYDDRTTTLDSASVFLARSADGGDTWKEYKISDHNFEPVPIGGLGQGYQGDNIDLSSTDTKLIPVWMDNSSGIYQLWTVPVHFADINTVNESAASKRTLLNQNFPNPCSHSTMIRWQLPVRTHISIVVFDHTGKMIRKLVDAEMAAGEHAVKMDVSGFPAGIYFYQMQADGRIETRKLVVFKP